jgi:hypothetical protein
MPKLTTSYDADGLTGGVAREAARVERMVGRTKCRSLQKDTVMFMRNTVSCPACALLQPFRTAAAAHFLHVVVSGDHLVVTEADDLHAPGRSLSALRIMELADLTVYRLLDKPSLGVDPAQHASAAGIAVLSHRDGRRRLKVTGVADGLQAHHDCIFDAVEHRFNAS